jgi:hypothetical protein
MDLVTQKYIKVGVFEGKSIFMYTCILDIKNINKKPIIIFFHGFAASGVLYYHIYRRLVERFCVIFAD